MLQDLMVYLKTTDTCQLDCSHCFTSGSKGAKIFFDPCRTVDFFHRLANFAPTLNSARISFHGGEPMLCPPEDMIYVWEHCKDLWPNLNWTIQTNLTFKLNDQKIKILEDVCDKSWGTSWDYNIRWTNDKLCQLWKDNVRFLADRGHNITVMVSMSRDLIQKKEPYEIIEELIELGVNHVNFERITSNGNALDFASSGGLPRNVDIDAWLLKMWDQTIERKLWHKINNMFLESTLQKFIYRFNGGTQCRNCEQKILTINASGRIGGCPNKAAEITYGELSDEIATLLTSEGRLCNITQELERNPVCASCEVNDICNGDCYLLEWNEDVCAAPKSLMKRLKTLNDTGLYKTMLSVVD